MNKSVGQQMQNWLIRNGMDVTDPLFVRAIDHAFENTVRKAADRSGAVREAPRNQIDPSSSVA
jgi:hypothetical protein